MKTNIGNGDRIARVIIGAAIGVAGIYYQSWWGLLGLIPIATAASGMCLFYSLFGVNTCKVKEEKK
ncbi:MAG: DUF2892 domain-containing protein [Ignavibacteriales bacterium]|nr:MAG: DUF2892 domain-containing protein [Ignavibacteriaceae bacterium]MBW7872254.1 DUF2892 domain-containing protein [Ignavibacteria bacterium]MCZ2144066.1 DUF2892 domain-containing protein [Ignavibacteriales bacterium]OQY79244.1 MAG: hypothetical protein B6D45_01225 [Ignavibacteriales bacterium UTCHB3]MBV6445599.1 hypothetical protein [Ignavibacteriaceae bacterium]